MVILERNPSGEPILWLEPDGRHDIRTGVEIVSPLSSGELETVLRSQLESGLQAFLDAETRAESDVVVAETARQAVLTLRSQAQAFSPSLTYQSSQLRDIAGAIAQLADQVAGLQQWRGAVDQNAVATDDALVWLGRLAGGSL